VPRGRVLLRRAPGSVAAAAGEADPSRADRAVDELAPVRDDGGRARLRVRERGAPQARRTREPRPAVRARRTLTRGRRRMARAGLEPATPRFSAECSTS